MTRKPSNPASRSALRYSVTYMPKRHGPHAPAVRKTYFFTTSWFVMPLLVAELDERLHEITDGEIRRVALAAVAVLLAGLEGRVVRARHVLHVVTEALQRGLDQRVLDHREAADEQRDVRLLALGEVEARPSCPIQCSISSSMPRRLRSSSSNFASSASMSISEAPFALMMGRLFFVFVVSIIHLPERFVRCRSAERPTRMMLPSLVFLPSCMRPLGGFVRGRSGRSFVGARPSRGAPRFARASTGR